MLKTYNVEEIAEILSLNPNTVRIKIRNGEFEGYVFKTGRQWMITDEDLKLWIEEQKKKASKKPSDK